MQDFIQLLKYRSVVVRTGILLIVFTSTGCLEQEFVEPIVKDETVITDSSLRADMKASENRVVWRDTLVLSGLVFVEDKETLVIEPGTIVKHQNSAPGQPGTSLIIARGGKIDAKGTKEAPIIFTYEDDPADGLTKHTVRGRWGGLIILGKASLNTTPKEKGIEGIATGEKRALYGGNKDDDSSGTLQYISIRHGGKDIGAGNEINGLTLGGVGSKTTLEYIEIVSNKDDGIEFFGGTARVHYLISAYNQDDAIDYDEGFRGMCQFVIIHQDPTRGFADRGFECDGGTSPETSPPYAIPLFVNVTALGNSRSDAATFRDNAGGLFYNVIFKSFNKGVDIEDTDADQDSWKHAQGGLLKFSHNLFDIKGIQSLEQAFLITKGGERRENVALYNQISNQAQGNRVASVSFTPGTLQPISELPGTTVPEAELAGYAHQAYKKAAYIGAIGPGATEKWYEGWSFYDKSLKK